LTFGETWCAAQNELAIEPDNLLADLPYAAGGVRAVAIYAAHIALQQTDVDSTSQ
jgi:hypothetical protein